MVLTIVCGLTVAVYLYSVDKYALVYYGDAGSHLVAARKLFDWSENPGWSQIGTVWLPLPHVLLMFPSFIDDLFFSGFAGLAISLPSLSISSVLLYKIITRLLSKLPNTDVKLVRYAAMAGALLYALNHNFLYLGITAMTEAPFMLFFVGCAYFLLRWYEELEQTNFPAGLKYLLLSSIFASAATLCRYEGWILPLFLISFPPIFTTIKTLRYKKDTPRPERHSNGPRTVSRAFAFTVLFCMISFSGIVFWLAFNATKYGDPLEFANAQYYSAASQALDRSFRENLYLQPYNVFSVYSYTGLVTYGPIVLSAAGIGYLMHRRTTENQEARRYLFLVLGLPPIFTILTLLIGIGEMSYWFNSRFIILIAPLLMVLVGIFIAKLPKKIASSRLLLVGVIASLFAFQLSAPAFGQTVTYADARAGFTYKHAPFAVLAGEKLSSLYDGTGSIMIMTGSAQEHRIMLASGIPFKNFDSIIESSTWKKSFYEPWNYNDKWIVLAKDPDSDGVTVVKYWNERMATLDRYYDAVFENEYYKIMALKP